VTAPSAPKPDGPSGANRTAKRGRVLVVACLLLISAVGIGWLIHVQYLASVAERERAALIADHRRTLAEQADETLHLAAAALRWAVTDDLLAGDYSGADAQIARLVKEPGVLAIAIADTEGTIRAATNDKLEGMALRQAFPDVPASEREIAFIHKADRVTMVIPIAYDGRTLGNALVVYATSRSTAVR
jgi:hypothetical protein